jgi:8-oxo-dGTP pyrophosphatase MutT (NUDIX family)
VTEQFAAPAVLPDWLRPLAEAAEDADPGHFMRLAPEPGASIRRSAVLVLFGEGPNGPDLLLIERASTLRQHAGQPAFPGGGADPDDDDAVQTALREAQEETGVDPAGVEVFAALPDLYLPVSSFAVTPVLAWWREPGAVGVRDPAEVAAVVRVPIAELVDPAHRGTLVHPSGYLGPAFEVAGLLVWGFTAALLSGVLELGGFARHWDADRRLSLPPGAWQPPPRTVQE